MLTYVSTATSLLSVPQLVDMLDEIRPRNEDRGLTGMLLYSGGNIIQALEGQQAAVERVFQAILRDARHRDVTVLERGDVADRSFPHWSMGFRHVSEREVRDVATLQDFVRRPVAAGLGEGAGRTFDLLSRFREHA